MNAGHAVSGALGRGNVTGLLTTLLLSSCAAAPFLVPVAVEFARNLFQTGMQNYGSRHRDNLSNLVNRLASPYMQGLPPPGMAGPGLPGQSGFGGPPIGTGQPGMMSQHYPGQQATGGQPGVYDSPYLYGGVPQNYPGATTYPGGVPSPYGTAPVYPGPPGAAPHDPPKPYGQPAAPYGPQTNPYGNLSLYGQPANPSGGQAAPYGSQNPYGAPMASDGANPYGTQSLGGQQSSPYGSMPQAAIGSTQPGLHPYDPANPYGAGAVPQPYGQTQPGFGQPYGQQMPGSGSGTVGSFGMQPPPQAHSSVGSSGQPYGPAGLYPRSVEGEPVTIDVAMIRQKQTSKGKEVVLMNDGEVLKDGGSHKEAGDRFKIAVRTNCDCYVYVMSIDGSGWAEPVFPIQGSLAANPLKKDQEYAFPEDGHWYTLDQVKGIESFFVVASASRRMDLEESFAQLAVEKRPDVKIVAKVEEPPVIPRGVGSVTARGILKVQDNTGATIQVTPLSYAAAQPGQDVTVTRWFKHE